MTRRPAIPASIRRWVERTGNAALIAVATMVVGIPMVVEHIVPLVSGGTSATDNLCLSCYRCNEFKGSRRHALDATTEQSVALFHPRQQRWAEHFVWEADRVMVRGLTPHGRATLALLRLNNPWLLQARRIWILVGLQPPLE